MSVPFEFPGGHLVVVPVSVEGDPARFLLDTGAGLDLLSPRLARRLGLAPCGRFTGRRMTGEELTLDLVTGPDVALGPVRETLGTCAVSDILEHLPPELGRLDGALSLRCLARRPFTLDYPARRIAFGDASPGESVRLRTEREHGFTLALFAPATLDGKIAGSFLLDTGATLTVVAESTRARLGARDVEAHEGRNETGRPYRRTLGTIREVAVGSARQSDPRICFEDIRYDGVLGNDFLQNFAAHFDVAGERLTLRRP